MKRRTDVTCVKCGSEQQATSWKSLDVVAEPDLRDVVMSREFNVHTCTSCGEKNPIATSLILWEAHFIAVAMARRLEIAEAAAEVSLLLRDTRPERPGDLPRDVLVFGALDQMRKALVDPSLTRIRVPLLGLLMRDWSFVTHPLEDVVDALIQQDMPERGALIFREVILQIPEIYANPDVRQKFLMASHVAGSRIPPEQTDNRTAREQAEAIDRELQERLESMQEIFEPYQVTYCPVDETTETGEGHRDGDMHAFQLAIEHLELPRLGPEESSRGCLLVHMALSLALSWLPQPRPDLLRWQRLNQMKQAFHWDRLSRSAQEELNRWFYELTGAQVIDRGA